MEKLVPCMARLVMQLTTENRSTAEVTQRGRKVTLTVDASHHWTAEELREFPAMLEGVAGMMKAGRA